MKKQLIFSAMLGLCALGSAAVYPMSAVAAVTQSSAIKVRGQVVDEQGEPLLGATIRIKNTSSTVIRSVKWLFAAGRFLSLFSCRVMISCLSRWSL